MAPSHSSTLSSGFKGTVKVCRPSVQKAWKWGSKPTPSSSVVSKSLDTSDRKDKKETEKAPRRCFKCNSKRHVLRDCPQLTKDERKKAENGTLQITPKKKGKKRKRGGQ